MGEEWNGRVTARVIENNEITSRQILDGANLIGDEGIGIGEEAITHNLDKVRLHLLDEVLVSSHIFGENVWVMKAIEQLIFFGKMVPKTNWHTLHLFSLKGL